MKTTFHPYKKKSWLPTKSGKRGKYNSVSATYNGRVFHSRKEALYAAELDLMKKATLPAERVTHVQYQVKVPLDVEGKHICDYYCDFLVTFADGHQEFQEVKGFSTDVWLMKEKLFRALYPMSVLKVIR